MKSLGKFFLKLFKRYACDFNEINNEDKINNSNIFLCMNKIKSFLIINQYY